MSAIVLATLNARYSHASLGLRYLHANLGELAGDAQIREFIIGQPIAEIGEALLALQPRIVGLGVYIWNAEESLRLVALLKTVQPDLTIVLGGPEVSHESAEQEIVSLADYVVCGPGEAEFAALCRRLLRGERPQRKIRPAAPLPPERLALPYHLYSAEDIAHRIVYVEASRGCPFRCEFCLSSLDRRVETFALEAFLDAMDGLYQRGLRHYKFVDRTFNLDMQRCLAILEFFLARLDDRLFLHFELVPDHLPETLKAAILRFPPGVLQFEVGVQTFNPTVQTLISRRQDIAKTEANLRWLREHTHVHLHADLIAGLPGEDLASFAAGFDRLVALCPHDIQVGILKRLRGTPIIRHSESHRLRFAPYPPYSVLATDCLDFATLQHLARFARYWEMIGNSGRFPRALELILAGQPFARFSSLTAQLWKKTGKTSEISLERLFDLIHDIACEALAIPQAAIHAALAADYAACGARGSPHFLRQDQPGRKAAARSPREVSP